MSFTKRLFSLGLVTDDSKLTSLTKSRIYEPRLIPLIFEYEHDLESEYVDYFQKLFSIIATMTYLDHVEVKGDKHYQGEFVEVNEFGEKLVPYYKRTLYDSKYYKYFVKWSDHPDFEKDIFDIIFREDEDDEDMDDEDTSDDEDTDDESEEDMKDEKNVNTRDTRDTKELEKKANRYIDYIKNNTEFLPENIILHNTSGFCYNRKAFDNTYCRFDFCPKYKVKGRTFMDLAEAFYRIKSHKFDTSYEDFYQVTDVVVDFKGNIFVYIEFEHESEYEY